MTSFGFCHIQNNQGLGKGYSASANNPYHWSLAPTSTLIILDITKTSSNKQTIASIWLEYFSPRTLSVPRTQQYSESVAGGKL